MYVDNITSKGVTLNSAGKSMQIEVYEKEIERLNNVINELEKDTIELMKSYKDVNAPRYDMCKYFIYKIQELKEGK